MGSDGLYVLGPRADRGAPPLLPTPYSGVRRHHGGPSQSELITYWLRDRKRADAAAVVAAVWDLFGIRGVAAGDGSSTVFTWTCESHKLAVETTGLDVRSAPCRMCGLRYGWPTYLGKMGVPRGLVLPHGFPCSRVCPAHSPDRAACASCVRRMHEAHDVGLALLLGWISHVECLTESVGAASPCEWRCVCKARWVAAPCRGAAVKCPACPRRKTRAIFVDAAGRLARAIADGWLRVTTPAGWRWRCPGCGAAAVGNALPGTCDCGRPGVLP